MFAEYKIDEFELTTCCSYESDWSEEARSLLLPEGHEVTLKPVDKADLIDPRIANWRGKDITDV